MKKKFRNRGLPSLNQSAIDRRKQLVTGRARVGGGIPPKLFLSGLAVLVVGSVIYFFQAQAELNEQRNAILTKQRATAQLLGPKLLPLRQKMEGFVTALAQDDKPSLEPGVEWDKVFASPSLYLRLRLEDAKSSEGISKAAEDSLRDGFTACLLRDTRAQSPLGGKECRESNQCEAGELCNEYKHCARPSSPYNMRLLYRALVVLSDRWVNEVKEAGTEYKLTAYDRSLDSVTQVDIPVAIEVNQAAKYAFVVIDEDPKDGLPAVAGEEYESPADRVARVAHPARVGVWDLASGKLLARVHEEAAGELRMAGTREARFDLATNAARARTANSCGLALGFRADVQQSAASAAAAPAEAQLVDSAEGKQPNEATPAASEGP